MSFATGKLNVGGEVMILENDVKVEYGKYRDFEITLHMKI